MNWTVAPWNSDAAVAWIDDIKPVCHLGLPSVFHMWMPSFRVPSPVSCIVRPWTRTTLAPLLWSWISLSIQWVYRRKSMPLICEKILIFARREMQSKSSESCHIVSVKLVRNRAPDNSSYSKARKNGNPQACGWGCKRWSHVESNWAVVGKSCVSRVCL